MKLNSRLCSVCVTFAALAKEQNPVLGYWDPIGLADIDLWGQGTEASIGARRRHCVCSLLFQPSQTPHACCSCA